MAGAMNIGDLAFVTEEIFNTYIDFGREISQVDHQLVHIATNKLVEMVNVLRSFAWPDAASDEVNQIKDHLDPEYQDMSDTKEFVVEETTKEDQVTETVDVLEEDTENLVEQVSVEQGSVEQVIEVVKEDTPQTIDEETTNDIEQDQTNTAIDFVHEKTETSPRKDAVVTEDTIVPSKPLV